MREFTAADGYTTRDLVAYARDHVASARVLFQTSFDCFDSAGYLSHLGIELLLKAFLLHHTGRFPNEHDLVRLVSLVWERDPTIVLSDAEQRVLAQVNTFNFSRYPVPTRPVPIGDEDWDGIEQLWRALVCRLPPTLQEEMRSKFVPTPDDLQSCTDGDTVMVKGNRVLMRRRKDAPGG
jgi:HEPN domain-containing protein